MAARVVGGWYADNQGSLMSKTEKDGEKERGKEWKSEPARVGMHGPHTILVAAATTATAATAATPFP